MTDKQSWLAEHKQYLSLQEVAKEWGCDELSVLQLGWEEVLAVYALADGWPVEYIVDLEKEGKRELNADDYVLRGDGEYIARATRGGAITGPVRLATETLICLSNKECCRPVMVPTDNDGVIFGPYIPLNEQVSIKKNQLVFNKHDIEEFSQSNKIENLKEISTRERENLLKIIGILVRLFVEKTESDKYRNIDNPNINQITEAIKTHVEEYSINTTGLASRTLSQKIKESIDLISDLMPTQEK